MVSTHYVGGIWQYNSPISISNLARAHYRQLWVTGRHIRAEVLYRFTIGAEPRTPEEVARDYDLPVAAVQEAIDDAMRHQELFAAERAREVSRMQHLGLDQPPFVRTDTTTDP